jgi:DNA repair exonuclease SbcCD ATPase subunit
MSRALTVKVPVTKVIEALESSLAKLETNYLAQETNEAKYQKAREAWTKEIQDYAIAHVKKAVNLRTNYRSWNNTLNIDYDIMVSEKDLPKEPEKDFVTIHHHEYKETKEDISSALRILKMTEEEFVSASTMKAVSKYL